MSKLKELREKRARLITEARSRLDEITANTDESRAAELEAQHDAAMAEIDKIEKQIEREERMAELEANAQRQNEEERERRRPTEPNNRQPAGDNGEGEPEYRHVFAKIMCGVELADLSTEERAVLRQGVTKFKDGEQRAQVTGTNTAGGYTVPTELAAEIIKSMKLWGPMYDEAICRVVNHSSGHPWAIPTVDDTASTAGAHTEGSALTDDGGKDVTFGQKVLGAYAFDTEFVRWSWELDMDSIFSMEALLGELLGERLGRIANTQLTSGNGTTAPNGIVTASTLGKTAAAAAAITSDEVLDLFHSVDPAYRTSPKARWMFNDATLLVLRKLKDGDGNYLWQMGDIKTGAPDTLWSKPYSINQAMDSVAASKKPIVFGDFGKYFVRKVGSPIIGVLRERFWPDMGIAGLIRFDGELGDTAAIKHLATPAS
ncbi:phage major capsid protein, HK97 family [Sphingomonas sp. MM-1]|uniref:phage major capsid protein n=1 Tax=Sphingomonas sp. MM-1 TaxID=745310 RepID=UPI0002C12C45|nr:phage major capsid protein [Sphingomonas sp. MM-1]AGH48761.1 phage major capsid protein, HK97 family [Sphingomonas sp. MM-1]